MIWAAASFTTTPHLPDAPAAAAFIYNLQKKNKNFCQHVVWWLRWPPATDCSRTAIINAVPFCARGEPSPSSPVTSSLWQHTPPPPPPPPTSAASAAVSAHLRTTTGRNVARFLIQSCGPWGLMGLQLKRKKIIFYNNFIVSEAIVMSI